MKVFKNITYRLTGKENPAILFERVQQAFTTAKFEPDDIKFFLNDLERGAWGIKNLLSEIPRLEVYRFTSDSGKGEVEHFMSNLPVRWYGVNPKGFTESLSMKETGDILRGIPEYYPLHNVTILFDKLSILRTNPDTVSETMPFVKESHAFTRLFNPNNTFSDYPSPCIRLWSNGVGRHNFLEATIDLGEHSLHDLPSQENDETQGLLESLGDIYQIRHFAVPSTNEEAASIYEKLVKGQHILEGCYDTNGDMVNVKYPHLLQRYDSKWMLPHESTSIKKTIVREFRLRKFIYDPKHSGGGIYTLVRKTKNNNLLKLAFELDKFKTDLSCIGSLEGPLWKHSFTLPVSSIKGRLQKNILILNCQRDVDAIVANIAASYDAITSQTIDRLDELYGKAPKWF